MTDESAQLGPSHEGSVLLDIGGDYGALILRTSADLLLAELEIERVDGAPLPHGAGAETHSHGEGEPHAHGNGRTHVAVRERRGPSGTQYAAIYPSLPSGEYRLFDRDGNAAETLTVHGGEVTEIDWR